MAWNTSFIYFICVYDVCAYKYVPYLFCSVRLNYLLIISRLRRIIDVTANVGHASPPPRTGHLNRELAGLSEEIRFLHDAQELFFIDFAITVAVCLIDHLLQLLIGHTLTQLFCDALQVLERYFSSLVVIEEAESFEDFVLRVAVQDLVCHHLEKFFIKAPRFEGGTHANILPGGTFANIGWP